MTPAEDMTLRADCGRCAALCCVVPVFARSADFAADKPAGTPCPHLDDHHRCSVHDRLRPMGYRGCDVYDCLGAGQRLTAALGPAVLVLRSSESTGRAFTALRGVHELGWLLQEAAAIPACAPLSPQLEQARARVATVAGAPPEQLAELDLDSHRAEVNPILLAASELARAHAPGPRTELRGADLTGVDLRRRDLRSASLRGALLTGADLRGVDLAVADLTGADLRGADLRGARIAAAIFVGDWQLRAATGDVATAIPPGRSRPPHWSDPAGPPDSLPR